MENKTLAKQLEREIAKLLEKQSGKFTDHRFVIVHTFDIKSVRTMSRNDETGILVAGQQSPRQFQQASTLFASIDERYTDAFVEVYAPVSWDTNTERQKTRSELNKPIRELIETICSGQKQKKAQKKGGN